MNLTNLAKLVKGIPQDAVDQLKELVEDADDIIIIGNGGSNAIASHMAVDYAKFLHKRCFIPNAADMISMLANDYGVEEMYSKFIDYATGYGNTQLAILISSSGNSENMIRAAKKCYKLKIPMVILTGFTKKNKLRSFKSNNVALELWVDSKSYGEVEMVHHIFLHSII